MFYNNFQYKKSKIKEIKKVTIYCLISASVLTSIAINISLFIPNYKNRTKFQFPEKIDLPNWQFVSSDNLDKELNQELNKQLETTSQIGIADARRYFYTSFLYKDLSIDLMYVRKLVVVPALLKQLNLKYVNSSFKVSYSDSVGYYALFTDRDLAYLSSCINPRGKATVTSEQFMNNRNTYDISGDRILSYLIGTSDLRDTRCLFTIMSVPLKSSKTENVNGDLLENSYKKLEKVWFAWYQKWENNFPNQ
jgi:cyanosortase A-associated protein